MRAVVQRVARASRRHRAARSDAGLCVLLGVADGDDEDAAERLAEKIARLRIFENDDGRFDRSLLDTGGAALVVSPVHADRRHREGEPAELRRRREAGARGAALRAPLRRACGRSGSHVETGVFGARMAVELVNDGPVTIVLDL